MAVIAEAVAAGELSLGEVEAASTLIDRFVRAIEPGGIEPRLRCWNKQPPPRRDSRWFATWCGVVGSKGAIGQPLLGRKRVPGDRCRFGEQTFVGGAGNGSNAPAAVIPH